LSRDHKCSLSVQLHVLQEVLELFHLEDTEQDSAAAVSQDQLFLVLSQAAVSGSDGPRTLRLQGFTACVSPG